MSDYDECCNDCENQICNRCERRDMLEEECDILRERCKSLEEEVVRLQKELDSRPKYQFPPGAGSIVEGERLYKKVVAQEREEQIKELDSSGE